MKLETKAELINLCSAINDLGAALALTIGLDNAANLRTAAVAARNALIKEGAPATAERTARDTKTSSMTVAVEGKDTYDAALPAPTETPMTRPNLDLSARVMDEINSGNPYGA